MLPTQTTRIRLNTHVFLFDSISQFLVARGYTLIILNSDSWRGNMKKVLAALVSCCLIGSAFAQQAAPAPTSATPEVATGASGAGAASAGTLTALYVGGAVVVAAVAVGASGGGGHHGDDNGSGAGGGTTPPGGTTGTTGTTGTR
jgi:hypothetical protein